MRRKTSRNPTACIDPAFRAMLPALRQGERHGPSRTTSTNPARIPAQHTQTTQPFSDTQGTSTTRPRSLDILYSSATPEWNTPRHVIDHVLTVLGSVDLDPCSNSRSDPNVPARRHYTRQEDGLTQVWTGRVYMNPPYGRDIGSWVRKLHDAYQAGYVSEAVALLPARTDTQWFRILRPYPKCFVTGRLKFGEARNSAPFPSVVVYLGNRPSRFAAAFSPLGDIYTCLPHDRDRTDRCRNATLF
jgi:hypothetical protein